MDTQAALEEGIADDISEPKLHVGLGFRVFFRTHEPRFSLTAYYQDARGPRTREIKHHMFLPHEIFASLHDTGHADLLYDSTQHAASLDRRNLHPTRNPETLSSLCLDFKRFAFFCSIQGSGLLGRSRSAVVPGSSDPE